MEQPIRELYSSIYIPAKPLYWEALFLNSVYSYSDVLSLISYGIYSMSRPVYCTISTVSSRILKICWPRWPINFLLSSSDLKQGLFFWPLRVTELTVEMVQYTVSENLYNWPFGQPWPHCSCTWIISRLRMSDRTQPRSRRGANSQNNYVDHVITRERSGHNSESLRSEKKASDNL